MLYNVKYRPFGTKTTQIALIHPSEGGVSSQPEVPFAAIRLFVVRDASQHLVQVSFRGAHFVSHVQGSHPVELREPGLLFG